MPLWREAFAGLDWLALRCSPVYFGAAVPRGDGSPVIIVPGLFASDACLVELYGWLSRIGCEPHFSGVGLNPTCPALLLERLVATVDSVSEETSRKARLVGHSLGGLLARGAALRRPGKVAQVITLGSPVHWLAAHPAVLAAGEALHGEYSCDTKSCLQAPPASWISETSIFTREDGVVDWRTCLHESVGANTEVSGTHSALIINANAFEALGRSLATKTAEDSQLAESLFGRNSMPVVAPVAA